MNFRNRKDIFYHIFGFLFTLYIFKTFRRRNRLNPLNIPNDREFKARFRFNKDNFRNIVEELCPHLKIQTTNHGLPCSPELLIGTGLEIMAGGHFFRVASLSTGVATATASNHLYRYWESYIFFQRNMTVERGFEFYSKDDIQVVPQLQMFHGTLCTFKKFYF